METLTKVRLKLSEWLTSAERETQLKKEREEKEREGGGRLVGGTGLRKKLRDRRRMGPQQPEGWEMPGRSLRDTK